jgi:CHASE3 domain sensor protein
MSGTSLHLLRATYAFAAAAFLTLVVLVAVTFWLLEKTSASTEEVLMLRWQRTSLTRLLSAVQDAETGQRGYLLTGEPRYLSPYLAAIKNVPVKMSEVRSAFDK